jgi:hypothetical protein
MPATTLETVKSSHRRSGMECRNPVAKTGNEVGDAQPVVSFTLNSGSLCRNDGDGLSIFEK